MESHIQLNIPLLVSYTALESVLQQQLVGRYIPEPEAGTPANPYAQVLGVGVTSSSTETYNLMLRVQIKILRTMLKRDKVDLYASVALAFDNATQQLYVRQFSMESNTSSGFYNTALEVLVNKVAYKQIIDKTRINISTLIESELQQINKQLEEGLELKGVQLKGAIEEVTVQDIRPKAEGLALQLQAQGNLEIAIYDLTSFLSSKEELL